jgi:sorting nexin-8
MRKNSLDFPEVDPWASPALHKGHNHEAPAAKPIVSRQVSNGVREPVRTTSTFTTGSTAGSNGTPNQPSTDSSSVPVSGWGSYDSNASFGNSGGSGIGGDGFGVGGDGSGEDRPPPTQVPSRSFGGGRTGGAGVEETVVITLLPEKEGMFMFQHHNYQVSSVRKGSKVVRRYSDFVWLLDCLQKRFPFRQLPLLPPKRVGGKLFYCLEISLY